MVKDLSVSLKRLSNLKKTAAFLNPSKIASVLFGKVGVRLDLRLHFS